MTSDAFDLDKAGFFECSPLDVFPFSPGFLCLVSHYTHRNRSDFCDLRLRCPSRTPEIARFPKQEKAMLHCDLRLRWKVASDLRFRAAISEPKTPSLCGISGDLAQSTRKSLAIAIVRFWCAKLVSPHYSATGDTISCDAPCSAIGFRGELFLRYHPC